MCMREMNLLGEKRNVSSLPVLLSACRGLSVSTCPSCPLLPSLPECRETSCRLLALKNNLSSLSPPGRSTVMQTQLELPVHLLHKGDESRLSDWFVARLLYLGAADRCILLCAADTRGGTGQDTYSKGGLGHTLNKLNPLCSALSTCRTL